MHTFFIILTLIASVLLILAILVQSPKSGMAANFGASNQIMGVRQTADFLEKFTWGSAVVILVLALATVIVQEVKSQDGISTEVVNDIEAVAAPAEEAAPEIPQAELPQAELPQANK